MNVRRIAEALRDHEETLYGGCRDAPRKVVLLHRVGPTAEGRITKARSTFPHGPQILQRLTLSEFLGSGRRGHDGDEGDRRCGPISG